MPRSLSAVIVVFCRQLKLVNFGKVLVYLSICFCEPKSIFDESCFGNKAFKLKRMFCFRMCFVHLLLTTYIIFVSRRNCLLFLFTCRVLHYEVSFPSAPNPLLSTKFSCRMFSPKSIKKINEQMIK